MVIVAAAVLTGCPEDRQYQFVYGPHYNATTCEPELRWHEGGVDYAKPCTELDGKPVFSDGTGPGTCEEGASPKYVSNGELGPLPPGCDSSDADATDSAGDSSQDVETSPDAGPEVVADTVETDGDAAVEADGDAAVLTDGDAAVEADGDAAVLTDGDAAVDGDGGGDTADGLDSEADVEVQDCVALAPACQSGAWDPEVGTCVFSPVDGSCDDGEPCTIGDECSGGACVGSAKDCSDAVDCSVDSCDSGSGDCQHDTSPCECLSTDDCSGVQLCSADNTCVDCLADADCEDDEPCTVDSCDDSGACVLTPLTDGVACGDPSTAGIVGICQNSACSGVQAVAAGWEHTCALLPGGDVVCWGANENGQLGAGPVGDVGKEPCAAAGVCSMPPSPVDLGAAASLLAGGGAFTCALLVTGDVRCWGANPAGQLGASSTDNLMDEAGEQASVVPLGSGTVTGISAGGSHACAVVDGDVRCWGVAMSGEVGSGATDNLLDGQGPVVDDMASTLDFGGKATAVACGASHTCALVAGAVRCWGSAGNLGSGDTQTLMDEPGETPSTVFLGTGAVASAISAQSGTCALVGGAVRCWGSNLNGNLGSGNYDGLLNGTTVPDAASTVDIEPASAVSMAGAHACAIVSGVVRCWGSNTFGSLGSEQPQNLLGQGAGGTSTVNLGTGIASAISTGVGHSCVIVRGQVRCWGNGTSGQLGQESTAVVGYTLGSMPPPITNLMKATGSLCSDASQCLSNSCVDGACQM